MHQVRHVTKQMFAELARRIVLEEDGQDLIEYGLLAGIVLAIGILIFSAISTKMGTAYETWGDEIQANWEPSNPAPPPPPAP